MYIMSTISHSLIKNQSKSSSLSFVHQHLMPERGKGPKSLGLGENIIIIYLKLKECEIGGHVKHQFNNPLTMLNKEIESNKRDGYIFGWALFWTVLSEWFDDNLMHDLISWYFTSNCPPFCQFHTSHVPFSCCHRD